MKKFVVLTYGFSTPTDEVKQAWGAWFASVGPHRIDPGSPFGRGTEITKAGRTELTLDSPSPTRGSMRVVVTSGQSVLAITAGSIVWY